ncbi:MAG TPA: tetratricopeptide repeat protein, partial [Bacteroidales bacterium]|nr:tetratricopeptide repeat protein [Bacteroidales bacterium]
MKTAEEYFEEGVEFQQQDHREKAIESYEKCVTVNPRYEKAYNNLGVCYRTKDPAKAIEYYKKATELNGAFYEAYIGWGNVLSDLNEDHEAREKFRKAIEIDPGKKQGHYKLGLSYAKNDASKAITCYQKAI